MQSISGNVNRIQDHDDRLTSGLSAVYPRDNNIIVISTILRCSVRDDFNDSLLPLVDRESAALTSLIILIM